MSWYADERADGAWRGVPVMVAGIGLSGVAVARALATRGARVTVVDGRDGVAEHAQADQLAALGVQVRLGADALLSAAAALSSGAARSTDTSRSSLTRPELVVTSPGWRPDHPLLRAAADRENPVLPVWGDVELAWRLRDPAVPWLGVTGTNGKTTTVQMLASMLTAAGLRTVAAGNVGLPVLDAVLAEQPYDVIAVELSSYQLHWSGTVACHAGALLNVAPDHLDWHGSLEAYAEAKTRIWRGSTLVVYNADDPPAVDLATGRPSAVPFTLGPPAPGRLGVRDGHLVDRAFVEDQGGQGVVLAEVADVVPAALHNIANALAAAALARSLGRDPRFVVPPEAIRAGLRAFRLDAHRIASVGTVDGVDYVDDSKATNTHAAAASLRAFGSVVWIAGGLAKGAAFDDLVREAGARLRAVVLLGRDRAVIAAAMARHAPDVPVVEVSATDTGAMDDVVHAAAGLARPGDTVLLAPACASMDMFTGYAERGDAFAAAVQRRSR